MSDRNNFICISYKKKNVVLKTISLKKSLLIN